MGFLVIVLVLLFIVMGIPIAFSIAFASLVYVLIMGIPLNVVAMTMVRSLDSFALLSVPLFVLAGSLMGKGGITTRLVNIADSFVGHIYGGLGMTSALASTIFGSIAGSANATAAAIGSITMPAMVEKGYDKGWAGALQSTASIIGVMIPPSIPMILVGATAGVSIGGMFIGGIVPGLMFVGGLMIVSYFYCKKTGAGIAQGSERRFSCRRVLKSLKEGLWGLGMPLVIIGGVFSGIFSATESAAAAVLYGLFVGFFIYKDLKLKDILPMLRDSMVLTSAIGFILVSASFLSWIMTTERIPQQLLQMFLSITNNQYVIMFLIVVFLLIIGTFLETTAAVIMLSPILVPFIVNLGYSPVFAGVLIVVILAVGMITPPVGVVLFVCSELLGIKVMEVIRKLPIFLLVSLVVILLLTYIPQLIDFLPNLVGL